ncbi:1439_t:CDS:2 [Dentiscutata erythropus]|uniref:1439_t:CDS:1 n=1 Tax=Dentiscutata erythropus TaxID=1348616 RepID=A0A9N9BNS9_9GLOM|nr:1439_t:CDS:2 [Dentiscutata erythropus]
MYGISTDKSFKKTLLSNIINEKKVITEQKTRLEKLKCHAKAQAKLSEKKAKLLEEGIVEKYEGPGRPLAAMAYPDFHTSNYGYPPQHAVVSNTNTAEDMLQSNPQVVIEWREEQSDIE